MRAQVPYLEAFIQEILRADPPLPAVGREVAVDMEILGHVIPKGTIILMPIQGPTLNARGWDVPEAVRSESSAKHADPGDWAETAYPGEEFNPERWLKRDQNGDVVYDAASGPFMTFGSGKRGCWGQKLAYLELKLITSLLIWNFEFMPLPAEILDWEVEDDIFAKPKNTFVRIKSLLKI